MKNYIGIISLLILASCALPMDYKCTEMNDEKYLCIDSWDSIHFEENNEVYADAKEWSLDNGDMVLENNWTNELVYEYAKKQANTDNYLCGIGHNRTYVNDLNDCFSDTWYLAPLCPILSLNRTAQIVTGNGKIISSLSNGIYSDTKHHEINPEKQLIVCAENFYEVYDNYVRTKEQEEFETLSKKEAEEQKKKIIADQKKYGYRLCSSDSIVLHMAQNRNIPKNCMVTTGLMALTIFQQTPDGTLVKYNHYSVPNIILVEKNKTISSLVDGQQFTGYFVGAGTYQYTNVLGATQTIQKVKYLGK